LTYALIGCSLALCLVFGTSAAGKLGNTRFREFAAAPGPLEVLPRSLRSTAAHIVVAVEVILTIALLAAAAVATIPIGASLAGITVVAFCTSAILVLAFTGAIVVTLRSGNRRPCRCFGASTVPLGQGHVIRNLILLAIALTGLIATAGRAGAAGSAGALVAAVSGLVAGLLITRFDDLVELFGPTDAATTGPR
jgi:hypothetical protein